MKLKIGFYAWLLTGGLTAIVCIGDTYHKIAATALLAVLMIMDIITAGFRDRKISPDDQYHLHWTVDLVFGVFVTAALWHFGNEELAILAGIMTFIDVTNR